jgi:HK97 family phage prohead protease
MEYRAFAFKVKKPLDDDEDEDDDEGLFSGFASVYDNVDLGGDAVMKGAFSKSIQSQGKGLPVLWQHRTSQPIGIGKISDTPNGLAINGKLVMEDPLAKRARAHMKAGSVRGLSIGYDAVKSSPRDDGGRNLHEVRLHEVSLVTLPMNPLAEVSSVKALLPTLQALRTDDLEPEDIEDLLAADRYLKRLLPRGRADNDADQIAYLRSIDAALRAALR